MRLTFEILPTEPQYPSWWWWFFLGNGALLVGVGGTHLAIPLVMAIVAVSVGFIMGWRHGQRAVGIAHTGTDDNDVPMVAPDDCPADHSERKFLTSEPGAEVRCGTCGIRLGFGEEF